jgi:uncharacterized RmlC-like cupin family protein
MAANNPTDPTDPTDTCRKVRPNSARIGKQQLLYAEGISAETVGSKHLHMQLATLPPMLRARAHKHEAHETAIYVISGESGVWYGENLQHHETVSAGEFFYIPANVPHAPYNPSKTEPCVTVIARTDPNDQESVMLLPELDAMHR